MKRTDSEIKQAIDLFIEGTPVKEICNSLNLPYGTFMKILDRNKVERRFKKGFRTTKNCKVCNTQIIGTKYTIKKRQFCTKECADTFKRGKPLKEFFGEDKARNVTETARRLSKNNPNLNKFTQGFKPWNKDWNKGSYFSKEATANIRKGQLKVAAMRKTRTSEEWMGKEGARIWKEKQREKILRLYASGRLTKQTNTIIEQLVKSELIRRGYKEGTDFIHQFKLRNKFLCDFFFPKQKLVVECDGDWWHANPNKYDLKKLHPIQQKDIKRDRSKNKYIRTLDNGTWRIVRFWETDIKKNVANCVDKIESMIS